MHYHIEVYVKDFGKVDTVIGEIKALSEDEWISEENADRIIRDFREKTTVEEKTIPDFNIIEREVSKIMFQYNDLWDWYQIGGRWSGYHKNIDPSKDPRNIEECWLCRGTGYRDDDLGKKTREEEPSFTCNSCGRRDHNGQWTHGKFGKGIALKWPTQWVTLDCDIIPVTEIQPRNISPSMEISPYAIYAGEEFQGAPEYNIDCFQWLKEHKITSGYFVTVDIHN